MARVRRYPEETPISDLQRRLEIIEGIVQVGGWQDWTPDYTNLTIGTGTVVARYVTQFGLVVAQYELTFAADTTIDGTNPTISLPVAPRSGYQVNRTPVGQAILRDDGTANYLGTCTLDSTLATINIRANLADATHLKQGPISATVPHTWAVNDGIAFTIAYERAS